MEPVLFVIAGTTVPRPIGPIHVGPVRLGQISLARALYYWRLCELVTDSELIAIDRGGLFHIGRSYETTLELIEQKRRLHYPGRSVIVVGQSQGALLALKYAFDPRVSGVVGCIPIVGPFGGSPHAAFWHPISGARCMAPGSRELRKIQMEVSTRLVALGAAAPPVHLVGSDSDRLVPWYSALPDIPGAQRHCFVSRTHRSMSGDIEQLPAKIGHLTSVVHAAPLRLYRQLIDQMVATAAAQAA